METSLAYHENDNDYQIHENYRFRAESALAKPLQRRLLEKRQNRTCQNSILYQEHQIMILVPRGYANDNKLTLLACSGSILAITLFGSPSDAKPAPKFNERVPQLAAAPMHRSKTALPTHTEELPTRGSYERRLQQAAISRFGCGCANCITSIRQSVRAGELAV
ncbi:hypothetical protein [Chamaesiphon sp. OTE_75_metabat_556]|uniref:hypothetical protein n=1 Tax=Chamaesiphon sp. OTE_75_metabat_556 TaxID=2964692 RepID=UPI00286A5E86|nr:hypothetical protein [Chamaesiphon sp. OTE_75_metabat_556]